MVSIHLGQVQLTASYQIAMFCVSFACQMPKIRNTDDWASTFRKQVRKLGDSWTVRETPKSGKVQVEIRKPKYQTTTLSFKWHEDHVGDAYTRIRNIYALVQKEGHDLKTAAKMASGDAPKLVVEHDWAGAVERFRIQKAEHGATIKEGTWKKSYLPVLLSAVDLLEKGKASNPETLIDLCIRDWKAGSRTRQIRSRNLVQFLKHCVYREKFHIAWLPSTDLKDHIGQKPTDAKTQSGDPITDQQIINLINSFPDDLTGQRWADAIRLLSELGLRPIELNFISVKTDKTTGNPYWWCSYQKRGGGGTTKPRVLHPLPLISDDGEIQQWNLMQRWQAKMIDLPNVENQNALKTYLNRKKYWKSLKAELKERDENLVPYSFRHSFSVRGHQRGVDNGSMSLAMGHSIECHCREYPWATDKGTETAFERANKTLTTAA